MTTLAEVTGRNLRRLRDERKWSQPNLAKRLNARGLGQWTTITVAKAEKGARRIDHLGELVVLCEVLGVPLTALLAGDDTDVLVTTTHLATDENRDRSLKDIRDALTGVATISEIDIPDEIDRILELSGLDEFQLNRISMALWQHGKFISARDERAKVYRGGSRDEIRGRRAGATRVLLAEMRAAIADQGIDVLMQQGEDQLHAWLSQGDDTDGEEQQ